MIQNPEFVKSSQSGPGPKSISSKPMKPNLSGKVELSNSNIGYEGSPERAGITHYNQANSGSEAAAISLATALNGSPRSASGASKGKIINKDFKAAYSKLQSHLINEQERIDGGSQYGGM